jgi:hypothetical protein
MVTGRHGKPPGPPSSPLGPVSIPSGLPLNEYRWARGLAQTLRTVVLLAGSFFFQHGESTWGQ